MNSWRRSAYTSGFADEWSVPQNLDRSHSIFQRRKQAIIKFLYTQYFSSGTPWKFWYQCPTKFPPILISYVPNLSHIFQRCSSCSGLIYDEKAKLNTLILSFYCRHLKQLGLGGEDSSFLRLTIGLAILAVGGIYAFRFFSNMRYLFSFVFRYQILILVLFRWAWRSPLGYQCSQ